VVRSARVPRYFNGHGGIGSFSYQHVTRDTFGFAMKATWCEVNGEGRNIFKMPKTGNGMKNSAKGRLAVLRGADGELELINQATAQQESDSLLRPVWRDGSFLIRENFADIRNRVLAARK
jgi:nicotinic acid phosphoribosyltransferase